MEDLCKKLIGMNLSLDFLSSCSVLKHVKFLPSNSVIMYVQKWNPSGAGNQPSLSLASDSQ